MELTGSIEGIFSNWPKLKEIEVNHNLFTGKIPGTLAQENPLLSVLRLDNNDFTGPIPASLGSLTGLHYLGLGANSLQNVIPGELGSLGNLSKCVDL